MKLETPSLACRQLLSCGEDEVHCTSASTYTFIDISSLSYIACKRWGSLLSPTLVGDSRIASLHYTPLEPFASRNGIIFYIRHLSYVAL